VTGRSTKRRVPSKKGDPTSLAATPLDEGSFGGRRGAREAAPRSKFMPIADLNSNARIVILAARKELKPAAGERERLEALLEARLGAGPAHEARQAIEPSAAT